MSVDDPTVRRVLIADLVVDTCGLTYADGTCTAVLGTTGDDRCYETRGTCQAPVPYAANVTTQSLRFILATGPKLPGVQGHYALERVRVSPARIDTRTGVGGRTDVSVVIRDFIDEDLLQDPYRDQRAEIILADFFVRFIKRNPHYAGRNLVVREGVLEADGTVIISDLTTETYILEKIVLGDNGKVKVSAKDASHRMTEVLMPATVNVELSASMDNSQTTATVKSGQGANLGSAPFFIMIDSEIMKVGAISTDSLSSITRAYTGSGTTAATHDADAKVVKGVVHEDQSLDTIWDDFCVKSGYAAGEIDSSGAATEVAIIASNLSFTCFIFEQKPVIEWMRTLMVSGNAYTWWDPSSAQQKLKTVRPRTAAESTAATSITDDRNIIEGSVKIRHMEGERITRQTVYCAPKNWSEDLDDPTNYLRRATFIDATEEGADAYGRVKEGVAIFAPFAPTSQFEEMTARAFREVSILKRAPRRLTVQLAIRDGSTLGLAADIDALTRKLVNDAGKATTEEMRIVSKKFPPDDGITYEFEMESTGLEGRWWVWSADPGVAGQAQWGDANGKLLDGSDGFRWV